MQDVCKASGTINIIYFKPCTVVAIREVAAWSAENG